VEPFTVHEGLVVALDRANVDTDQIIPKQFLKRIERTGFGQYLFFDWRFNDDGSDKPEFELNAPAAKGASILLARDNFGSGSSREHAVWALADFGIKALLAPSFADIFYNNCFKNGLLPIPLDSAVIDNLFERAKSGTDASSGLTLVVDLEQSEIRDRDGWVQSFEIEPSRRHNLLHGLDDIALTLKHQEKISDYEKRHPLPSIQ